MLRLAVSWPFSLRRCWRPGLWAAHYRRPSRPRGGVVGLKRATPSSSPRWVNGSATLRPSRPAPDSVRSRPRKHFAALETLVVEGSQPWVKPNTNISPRARSAPGVTVKHLTASAFRLRSVRVQGVDTTRLAPTAPAPAARRSRAF